MLFLIHISLIRSRLHFSNDFPPNSLDSSSTGYASFSKSKGTRNSTSRSPAPSSPSFDKISTTPSESKATISSTSATPSTDTPSTRQYIDWNASSRSSTKEWNRIGDRTKLDSSDSSARPFDSPTSTSTLFPSYRSSSSVLTSPPSVFPHSNPYTSKAADPIQPPYSASDASTPDSTS